MSDEIKDNPPAEPVAPIEAAHDETTTANAKNFTTWERLNLQGIVGGAPAGSDARLMRKIIKALDFIDFTPKERKEFKDAGADNRPLTDAELDRVWPVWIEDFDALEVTRAAVRAALKANDNPQTCTWKGVDARRAVRLLDKLGIE